MLPRCGYLVEAPQGRFSPQRLVGLAFPPTRARALNARVRARALAQLHLRPETLETVKISKVSGRKLSSNYDLKIISKLIDFLLFCVLKSAYFFIAKGPPHKWWRSMVSNANLDFG